MNNTVCANPHSSSSYGESEQLRLIRDGLINNVFPAVTAIVGILVVPLLLKMLGEGGYGLWIVAASLSGMIGAVDFGLPWTISRLVASEGTQENGEDADFIRSAGNMYVLLGIAGFICLAAIGMLSGGKSGHLGVDSRIALPLFCSLGVALCAEQISQFGFAVLGGLRRFGLINLISSLTSITWAIGIVVLFLSRGQLLAVAGLNCAIAFCKSAGVLWFVFRLYPDCRFKLFFPRWRTLRRHASFTLSSMLLWMMGTVTWNAAPVLIGYIKGAAAATPFYIGQRLPMALSLVVFRAAAVLFPAAAEHRHDLAKSREIFLTESRWLVVLSLPFVVLLFVSAPGILHVWIGTPPPGSSIILRILTATVLLEAISAAAFLMLWGRGTMRPILVASFVQGLGTAVATFVLIHLVDVKGAAWGMLVPIAISSLLCVTVASRELQVEVRRLAAFSWRGLPLPALGCALSSWGLLNIWNKSRLSAAAAVILGLSAYAAVFWVSSGTREEKHVARMTLFRFRDKLISIRRAIPSSFVQRGRHS